MDEEEGGGRGLLRPRLHLSASRLLPEGHEFDFSTGQYGEECTPGHGDEPLVTGTEPLVTGTAGGQPGACMKSRPGCQDAAVRSLPKDLGMEFPKEAAGAEGEPFPTLTGHATCPLQASAFLSGKWALKPLARSVT